MQLLYYIAYTLLNYAVISPKFFFFAEEEFVIPAVTLFFNSPYETLRLTHITFM